MILFTSDSYNNLAMEIHTSIIQDGSDGLVAAVTFQLEDQALPHEKRFEEDVHFNMDLDSVKQLHAWLGCILKSDWAKQKH